jgi:hypothetical protein
MANISTNINKTNNHLLSQITEYKKRPCHIMLKIHDLSWDRHKNVNGIPTLQRKYLFMPVVYIISCCRSQAFPLFCSCFCLYLTSKCLFVCLCQRCGLHCSCLCQYLRCHCFPSVVSLYNFEYVTCSQKRLD